VAVLVDGEPASLRYQDIVDLWRRGANIRGTRLEDANRVRLAGPLRGAGIGVTGLRSGWMLFDPKEGRPVAGEDTAAACLPSLNRKKALAANAEAKVLENGWPDWVPVFLRPVVRLTKGSLVGRVSL
jgi:hypothetical protein